MSVNYDLYETSNPDKEGEVLPLHARVLLKGSYTAEEFADQVVAFPLQLINKFSTCYSSFVVIK